MKIVAKIGIVLCLVFLDLFPVHGEPLQENKVLPILDSTSEPQVKPRWGRDPFYRNRPKANTGIRGGAVAETEEGPKIEFLLSAIIFQDGVGMAIINDRIVRRGDVVGKGVVVSRVFRNKVFLQKGKQRVVLQVKPFGSS